MNARPNRPTTEDESEDWRSGVGEKTAEGRAD
jgi:hypothetical protein